jgi:hypothetical protein
LLDLTLKSQRDLTHRHTIIHEQKNGGIHCDVERNPEKQWLNDDKRLKKIKGKRVIGNKQTHEGRKVLQHNIHAGIQATNPLLSSLPPLHFQRRAHHDLLAGSQLAQFPTTSSSAHPFNPFIFIPIPSCIASP